MPPDSLTLAAALALLLAALFAAWRGQGLYLRVAAALCGALALAVLAEARLPGLAAAASLPALPLAGAMLGLCGIARFARPMPPMLSSLILVAALTGGVMALFGFPLAPVLLPLVIGGGVIAIAAAARGAFAQLVAGSLLTASAPAFLARGPAAPGLLLLAASLSGLAAQQVASRKRAREAAAA